MNETNPTTVPNINDIPVGIIIRLFFVVWLMSDSHGKRISIPQFIGLSHMSFLWYEVLYHTATIYILEFLLIHVDCLIFF